jgi:hypothetical protein
MVTASQAEPRATRGQTAPVAGSNQEKRVKRTQSDDILQNITKLRDLYGQKQGKAARPIPFEKAEAVFKKMLKTRELRVDDAYERVKELVKAAEKVAERLNEKYGENAASRSYAQAARMGGAGVARDKTIEPPPTAHSQEEKRIVIKIADRGEAEAIKKQTKKDITGRIQQIADETQRKHRIIAVQKLKGGDLIIYINSFAAKKALKAEIN